MTDHQPPTVDRGVVVPRDELEAIISEADVIRVHGHANFGPGMTPRDVVNDGVRKYAVGYSGGNTQLCILMEHGLITKPRPGRYDASLTNKGKRYARALLVFASPPPAQSPAALDEAVGLLRRLSESSEAVRSKLATVPEMQNRSEFMGTGIEFVNAINAARAFLANLEPSQ